MFRRLPVVDAAMGCVHADIPDHLVGIHGKLYDVRDFAQQHPGGELFLEVGKGQDCTALFETHHLNIHRALDTLSRIPIQGEYTPIVRMDFARYRRLCALVCPLLLRLKKGRIQWQRGAWVLLMLVLQYLVCATPAAWASGLWWVLLTSSSAANTVCGSIGHDAVHRVGILSVLLDWNGLSSFEWLQEHVSSHHMYTNSTFDHDAVSMQPFVVWLKTRGRRASLVNVFGMHLIFLISEIAVALNGIFLHRARWSILGNNAFPWWMRLAPFVFLARIFSICACHGILTGMCVSLISVAISGYMFSFLAHLNHTPADYHDYTQTPPVDFIHAQLSATCDIPTSPIPSLDLGLDRQTLHHLFPILDHSVLTQELRCAVMKFVTHDERQHLQKRDVRVLYQRMKTFVS